MRSLYPLRMRRRLAGVVKKLRERAIKAFLDTIVLSELQTGQLSGYDVIDLLKHRYGYLVSSGTVYSLLYSLERAGLVRGCWLAPNKRVYRLTEKGRETVAVVAESREQIVAAVSEVFLNCKVEVR